MAEKKKRSDAERRLRQCERLSRLLRTLQLIMGKGRWDADALAEELECSRRTVHRILQTLSMAGVPWYFDEGTRAYRVRAGYRFQSLEQSLPVTDKNGSPNELGLPIDKLLRDGEAFAESLQAFLNELRKFYL